MPDTVGPMSDEKRMAVEEGVRAFAAPVATTRR
jgi:hypothetical protein